MQEYNLNEYAVSGNKEEKNALVEKKFGLTLSDKQEKVISEVKNFWNREIDFSELKNFFYQDVNFFKSKPKDFSVQNFGNEGINDIENLDKKINLN